LYPKKIAAPKAPRYPSLVTIPIIIGVKSLIASMIPGRAPLIASKPDDAAEAAAADAADAAAADAAAASEALEEAAAAAAAAASEVVSAMCVLVSLYFLKNKSNQFAYIF